MKIGNLEFKDYAVKKPVSISATGEFLTIKDIMAETSLRTYSLLSLPIEKRVEMVLRRYDLEPDFTLGIVGVGLLRKKEIMNRIKQQDEFGKTVLEAEIGYCAELGANLNMAKAGISPPLPKKAVPKVPDWKQIKKCFFLKLKTRALFCENTTDQVTTPFAAYRIANVHPVFAARGFTVIALTGANDVRTKFIPEAKNGLTEYISGIGHGAYSIFTGNNGNHILEIGNYDPAEVSKKAMHFLSCQTAGKLGPDCVAKGSKCYAGYDENFHLVWDDSATPVNEFICFAEADSTFDISMAKGATAKQAFDATIASFNTQLAKPGIPGSVAATWLKYDRDHLRLLGSSASTILPYRYVKICLPILEVAKQNALVEAGELV